MKKQVDGFYQSEVEACLGAVLMYREWAENKLERLRADCAREEAHIAGLVAQIAVFERRLARFDGKEE